MSPLQKRLLFLVGGLLVVQTGVLLLQYLRELDASGGRFGGDFISFWSAAKHLRAGEWTAIYAPDHWRGVLSRRGDVELSWFVYPPFALAGLWPLGKLPYGVAVAWWSVVPLTIYLGLTWLLAGRAGLPPSARWLAMALTLPFVSANLFTGQSGTVVATLFLAAAFFLPGRPALAGLCIGLTAIKPQFGLLLPFALAAAGQWRAFASAALTVVVLVAGSLLWVGPGMWADYLALLQLFGSLIGGGYDGLRSVALGPYVSLLAAGSPVPLAGAVQAALTLAMVLLVVRECRNGAPPWSLVAVGTLLATPYALTYDTPVLALAVVPLLARSWERGLRPLGLAALIALVVLPFVPEALIDAGVPFGPLALLLSLAALLNADDRVENGSPGLIRTGDHSINSRTLYR